MIEGTLSDNQKQWLGTALSMRALDAHVTLHHDVAVLNGHFTAEDLETLAEIMREMEREKASLKARERGRGASPR